MDRIRCTSYHNTTYHPSTHPTFLRYTDPVGTSWKLYQRLYQRSCISRQNMTAPYLEDERGAWLQLQHARGAQGLKHGVRVEAERLVDHHHRAHVVHDEAYLVGPAARL